MLHGGDVDSVANNRPVSFLDSELQRHADSIGAVAIALYEAGHTFRFEPHQGGVPPDWTGMFYFVGGWPTRPSPTPDGQLQGFPAALSANDHLELLELLGSGDQTRLVPGELWDAFAGCAALSTALPGAVVLARAIQRGNAPVLAVIAFADAERGQAFCASSDARDLQLGPVLEGWQKHAHEAHFGSLAHLSDAFAAAMARSDPADQMAVYKNRLHDAAARLARDMRCPDLRIYLERRIEPDRQHLRPAPPRQFDLYFASAPGTPDLPVRLDEPGPIGWMLRWPEPADSEGPPPAARLSIHNRVEFAKFPKQREIIYRGLKTLDSEGHLEREGHLESGEKNDPAPPPGILPLPLASVDGVDVGPALLIHPIALGGRTVGAIVCNGRIGAPYVFHDWDDTSLSLIGQVIGGNWFTLVYRQSVEADRLLQERAAGALNRFSRQTGAWAAAIRPIDDIEVLQNALWTAAEVAGVPPFASIRLFDPGRSRFRFDDRLVHGEIWKRPEIAARLSDTFDVAQGEAEGAKSTAEFVFRSHEPVIVDVSQAPDWFRRTFLPMRHGAFAPVYRGNDRERMVAIIDVRTIADVPFPATILYALRELGETAGLALALIDTRNQSLRAASELKEAVDSRDRAFIDLEHQLQSPHRNAVAGLDLMVGMSRQVTPDPLRVSLVKAMRTVRGHVSRSFRVGKSAAVFAELNRTGRITHTSRAALSAVSIREMAEKLILNQSETTSLTRSLHYVLDAETISRLYGNEICGDEEKLELALATIIENADKYSLSKTTIRCQALRSDDDKTFILEVSNHGRQIYPEEHHRIRERGFRGAVARDAVAEGQGIGLWLVDHLMMSFGGKLEIVLSRGKVEPHRFRLCFYRTG